MVAPSPTSLRATACGRTTALMCAPSRAAEAFLAAGLITSAEKDAIVSEAARSSCGY
jgi:hypothetical protein